LKCLRLIHEFKCTLIHRLCQVYYYPSLLAVAQSLQNKRALLTLPGKVFFGLGLVVESKNPDGSSGFLLVALLLL